MLGIHGVRRDGTEYYLSDLARELPDAAPGRWAGDAAAGLGLAGPAAAHEFTRLLQGRHPSTGRPMGTGRPSVAAYDLTFSAPKSASVLFALGGRDAAGRVVAAHEEAVAGAVWYLERHAVSAVRQAGEERHVVPAGGMVAGCFTHAVNRNGDPHLHSHVVMANLVHGADGRWGACDRRGLDAHRQAASAVYEAHLRVASGVCWSTVPGRVPEVVGIEPALLGEFSSRAVDIRTAGGSRRVAWAATRPAKVSSLPYDDLVGEWWRRARAAGLEAPAPRPQRRRSAVFDEHRVAGVLSRTPHGGARRRDVVAAMATGATDGVAAGALEHLVDLWVPASAVGVAESLHARRAVLPANHHLHALGARPLDPAEHAVWVGAARALDAYRGRWGLERSAEPLGAARPASLPAAHLADRVRTARQLEAARARLGLRPLPERALDVGLGR